MSREGPHVLFCAFAEVPGPSAAATRTAQLMRAFGDAFDVDALCLKGPEVAHIERLGSARMMRVPVDEKPYLERLAMYRRALGRQISGNQYDLVWCADFFSAAVAASYKEAQGFSLVLDMDHAPSETLGRLLSIDGADKKLRHEWAAGETAALAAATVVVAPSRAAARAITARVDPRRVHVLARAVNRAVFAPPSVELSLDPRRRVLVLGGREGGPLLGAAADTLKALVDRVGSDEVKLALAGSPAPDDARVYAALAARGLAGQVELIDATGPRELAAALCDAHVIVVPSVAELGIEPLAVPHRALEAMACRRATVLTGAAASFADTLVPGEDALIAAARSPADVATAVEKLLANAALRESVAQAGARRVEHEADLGTRLQQAAAFLSDTLGLALGSRVAEATNPFEPSSSGTQPPPPSSLPPPPVDDATDSGRHVVSQVAVREVARAAKAQVGLAPSPTFGDPLVPQPTLSHEHSSLDAASNVFTDEAGPHAPPPRPPTSPRAVDLAASSLEASLEDASELQDLPDLPGEKTVIAPPPEGLEELLASPADAGGADEWYGDTRIDDSMRYPADPTPGDTRRQVTPEPPTSNSPSMRTFAVDAVSLPDGDPWGHDTIADARPVFTSGEEARRTTGQERTPPPVEKTTGRNFLVDPELFERGPLDDATVDDMHLPRETSSSEG